jgi:hypothetical protein
MTRENKFRYGMFAIWLFLATFAIYASMNKTIFKTKSFPNGSTRTDTSATIPLNNYENIELQTALYGTDSCKIKIYVDGYYDGKWVNLTSDSLIADNATTTLGRGTLLRGWGTNAIKGVESIRVRNTLQAGGSDDSSSATYYNQYILGR